MTTTVHLAQAPARSESAGRPAGEPEARRRTGGLRGEDALPFAGAVLAAAAALGLALLLVLPYPGRLGTAVLGFLAFLGCYAWLLAGQGDRSVVRDRLALVVILTLSALLFTALVFVVGYTLFRGAGALAHLNFLSQDMEQAGPLEPLSVGGVKHAMVGTLQQISIALLITVPLGLSCAVFLTELPGRFTTFIRTIVEAMTALPSIVAGLFIYATFILILGFGKSGLAAALALSVMMLPIIIRAADVVLRLVPGSLKEASYALGAGHWRTVWHVVLPTSRSGLATAIILGTARGIGETSPVLLTAGFSSVMNANPMSGPQVSLPLAAFTFVRSPQPSMIARGFGAAAALLALVLVLFFVARIIGGRGPGDLNARQGRRRTVQSLADARRFQQRGGSASAPTRFVPAQETP